MLENATNKPVVTTFVKNLLGGGAERVAVNLLQGLPRDVFAQELVMVDAWGPFLEQVPADVQQTNLALGKNVSNAILPLIRYLQRRKPDVLISHLAHANVAAVVAAACARTGTKVVLIEHNDNSSVDQGRKRSAAGRVMQQFKSLAYRRADKIVGVSEGVSDYVGQTFGVPKTKLETIYNPVVNDSLLERSYEPLAHPWFAPGEPPVLLASGRLREQKDFSTLLKAFAQVRQARACRLLILGEGDLRGELEAEIAALGLQDDVALPGFVENPYAYMRGAAQFVLSSRWEGLPTVLVEAMACGCPVVATDCPSGPAEILEDGRLGPLVPVADPGALAQAVLATLENPTPCQQLEARAAHFSFENAISRYTELLSELSQPPGTQPLAADTRPPNAPLPYQKRVNASRVNPLRSRTLYPIIRGFRRHKPKSREG